MNIGQLPWWGLLIIIVVGIAIIMIIPFFKKNTKKNTPSLEQKDIPKNLKPSSNNLLWGIYNGFGKKQSIRSTVTVYVEEREDSCSLCRPFENKVISLEEFGQNVTTMSEAISMGYHHVGCQHVDIDYFHGTTIIPENKWTKENKQLRYNLRLKQYKIEEQIRDLKYKLDNENNSNDKQDKILEQLQKLEKELSKFCDDNNLFRNKERENPYISDVKKFN